MEWVKTSDRFPTNKEVAEMKGNGFLCAYKDVCGEYYYDIFRFSNDLYSVDEYDFGNYKGKNKSGFYDYDSEYGYCKWDVDMWAKFDLVNNE